MCKDNTNGAYKHYNFVYFKGYANELGLAYLQYEYLPGGSIDVKFTISRIVWIDALTGKKIYDVLWSILIAIGGGHLIASSMSSLSISSIKRDNILLKL